MEPSSVNAQAHALDFTFTLYISFIYDILMIFRFRLKDMCLLLFLEHTSVEIEFSNFRTSNI